MLYPLIGKMIVQMQPLSFYDLFMQKQLSKFFSTEKEDYEAAIVITPPRCFIELPSVPSLGKEPLYRLQEIIRSIEDKTGNLQWTSYAYERLVYKDLKYNPLPKKNNISEYSYAKYDPYTVILKKSVISIIDNSFWNSKFSLLESKFYTNFAYNKKVIKFVDVERYWTKAYIVSKEEAEEIFLSHLSINNPPSDRFSWIPEKEESQRLPESPLRIASLGEKELVEKGREFVAFHEGVEIIFSNHGTTSERIWRVELRGNKSKISNIATIVLSSLCSITKPKYRKICGTNVHEGLKLSSITRHNVGQIFGSYISPLRSQEFDCVIILRPEGGYAIGKGMPPEMFLEIPLHQDERKIFDKHEIKVVKLLAKLDVIKFIHKPVLSYRFTVLDLLKYNSIDVKATEHI